MVAQVKTGRIDGAAAGSAPGGCASGWPPPGAEGLTRSQRARLERILDAAERQFIDHGLAGATMEGIAKAASVAKATAYGYLANKDAAFRLVAERLAHRIEERVVEALGVDFATRHPNRIPATAEEAAERWAAGLFAKHELVFDVVRRSPNADELFQARRRVVRELFLALDERLIDATARLLSGAVDSCDASKLARIGFYSALGVAEASADKQDILVDLRFLTARLLAT